MLYVETNFLPKLRKCCHEIMVDICRKSQVALQVTSIKVMTFFSLRSTPFLAELHDFRRLFPREMVNSQKKGYHHSRCRLRCRLTSIGIDSSGWCAAKFIQLISCADRQKVWKPLIYCNCCNLNFEGIYY